LYLSTVAGRRIVRISSVLLTLWASSLLAQNLVIGNVSVVEVTTGKVLPKMTVVIGNGKIVSIDPKGTLAGAQVINGSGKFLIPSLWDMHVHDWEKTSLSGLYVANGVLGIRDMGSHRKQTRQWQEQMQAGTLIGPHIVTPGPIVDGPGPNMYPKLPVVTISAPEEVPAAVNGLMQSGADFIKPLSALSRDSYFALAKYTRAHHIVLAGHVPTSVTVREAVEAGQHSVEHMARLPQACSSADDEIQAGLLQAMGQQDRAASRRLRERALETFDEQRCVGLFAEMKRLGSWVTPTLSSGWIIQRRRTGEAQKDPNLKWIPEYLRADLESPDNNMPPPNPAEIAQQEKNAALQRRIVMAMKTAGVGILAGSDSGDPCVLPGFVVHEEMQLLVDNGLSPGEALRTATLEPARYFGEQRAGGSVDKGKIANLVLLDANPLDDIRNTKRIYAVIQAGKLFSRTQLDHLLRDSQ